MMGELCKTYDFNYGSKIRAPNSAHIEAVMDKLGGVVIKK